MTTILGIDAAWTAGEPSGVALVQQTGRRWRCLASAASYAAFVELADGRTPDWTRTGVGTVPGAEKLLDAASRLAGEPTTLVTVDMPVSTSPILGRRAADREVSRAFGAQWCSAHSPGPVRPGLLGAELSRQFSKAGYPVATTSTPGGTRHRLLEVYPHPALLVLLQRDRRVPYKVGKSSRYWQGASIDERIARADRVWCHTPRPRHAHRRHRHPPAARRDGQVACGTEATRRCLGCAGLLLGRLRVPGRQVLPAGRRDSRRLVPSGMTRLQRRPASRGPAGRKSRPRDRSGLKATHAGADQARNPHAATRPAPQTAHPPPAPNAADARHRCRPR